MLEIIFLASLFTIFYCYILYPFILRILSIFYHLPVKLLTITPTVSIVISAYNEASVIKKNIENKLKLNYPRNKLEIIVVSDASDDGTDEVVKEFIKDGVIFIRQETRQGKTAALNKAVAVAKGELICFADANSIWEENALINIVRNFSDVSVGYVTGKMIYINSEGNIIGDGCSTYMKYENMLRKLETQVGSIIGVDGGIDAVRKVLYEPMNPAMLPDFILPLKVTEKGYRVIYEPEAILKEVSLDNTKDEFKMRVRVILRSLHALWHMKHILNPFKFKVFAWQLFSHKLLRYFVWLFMLSAFILNILLHNYGQIYRLMLYPQIIFYLLVVIGYIFEKKNKKINRLTYTAYYFFLVNLSSAVAFFKFLKGENTVIWQPRKG